VPSVRTLAANRVAGVDEAGSDRSANAGRDAPKTAIRTLHTIGTRQRFIEWREYSGASAIEGWRVRTPGIDADGRNISDSGGLDRANP
jgi:hypothetical protein